MDAAGDPAGAGNSVWGAAAIAKLLLDVVGDVELGEEEAEDEDVASSDEEPRRTDRATVALWPDELAAMRGEAREMPPPDAAVADAAAADVAAGKGGKSTGIESGCRMVVWKEPKRSARSTLASVNTMRSGDCKCDISL